MEEESRISLDQASPCNVEEGIEHRNFTNSHSARVRAGGTTSSTNSSPDSCSNGWHQPSETERTVATSSSLSGSMSGYGWMLIWSSIRPSLDLGQTYLAKATQAQMVPDFPKPFFYIVIFFCSTRGFLLNLYLFKICFEFVNEVEYRLLTHYYAYRIFFKNNDLR